MNLKNTRTISEDTLSTFESENGGKLPIAYRKFLKKFNGGIPVNSDFKSFDDKYSDAIEAFLGIDVNGFIGFDYIFDVYRDRYPKKDFFPIAKTVSGNLVLLGIGKKNQSKIYLWDHNWESEDDTPTYENIHLVDESFSHFVENLMPEKEDEYGDLLTLFSSNNNEEMKHLIESGWDINTKFEIGGTAIQRCALNGNIEILKLLLKHGADTEGAIYRAFTYSRIDVISILLNAGANPNETVNGTPLLNKAIVKGDPKIVRSLLMAGADKSNRNEYGKLPLDIAQKKIAQGFSQIMEVIPLLMP